MCLPRTRGAAGGGGGGGGWGVEREGEGLRVCRELRCCFYGAASARAST